MKFYLIVFSFLFYSVSYAELYDSSNHPSNFRKLLGIREITQFDLLPKEGGLSDKRMGWSETYWPSNKGGIAYRWSHPNPQPFEYRLYSKEELKKQSILQLSTLSPAELYDIANNDYSYTLTRKTLSLFSKRDLWWEGICHGWAQAATHFPEPRPVIVKNKDGIKVPFGSSDVKGLLSMHEAYNYRGEKFGFIGKRCRVNGKVPGEGDERDLSTDPPSEADAETEECRDVNAGSFHIVIANMLGLLGKSFVTDIDRYNDVWNQPIVGFKSVVIGNELPNSIQESFGIKKVLRIKTTFSYGEELKFYTKELEAKGFKNFVSKLPVTGTEHQKILSREYEYLLELDAFGHIKGGEWISATRPDFMWNYNKSEKFKNFPIPLGNLGKIYRPIAVKE
jgi:Transglutaminase elicitor